LDIAVVIPTFDRPRRLRQALDSVTAQTRPPDEVHVVVDGGPSLGNLVADYKDRLPLTVHQLNENRGQAAARNHVIAHCRRHAIAFLDDDDVFFDRHLERLERGLRENPALALVYDDCEITRENPHRAGGGVASETRTIALEYDRAVMREYDYLPPSTWLARVDTLQRVGGFDDSFRCYEDWDLLLRLESWGEIRRCPGFGARVRITLQPAAKESGSRVPEHQSQSLRFDDAREDSLRRFQQKHGLSGITPMTFWEVAAAVQGQGLRRK
jgi:glycosyltransferase involved in cell wall biosynthesis